MGGAGLRPWLFALLGGFVGAGEFARATPQGQAASEEEEHDTLELRILSVTGTRVVVDRGAADLLRAGDNVFFRPREGGMHVGIVAQTSERTAEVELQGAGFPAEPGVRGFVRIPRARTKAKEEQARKPERKPREKAAADAPEHPGWSNPDTDYQQGQPLLAKVQPLRPSERPADVRGRWYTMLDEITSTEDDRRDSFHRLGASVQYDNLTGVGDRLYIDAELNNRRTDVPDNDDQETQRLRVDRLSYSWGGNRFEPQRYEFGRFLHDGMPEFGVIDGAEWSTRERDGDRYGFSAGWLLEPDYEYQSGHDFSVSGFYRWVFDDSERLSAAAGFQKSWHDSAADRDLVVLRASYLPRDAWNFVGSAWIDIYTDGDAVKGQGVELTQGLASLTRTWNDGYALGFRASRIRFPEIDRNEFTPVLAADLADAGVDRLSAFVRNPITRTISTRIEIGWWQDEDDTGADGEVAVQLADFAVDRAVLEVAGFGNDAQFSDGLGVRVSWRRWLETTGWSLDYEMANNNIVGFSSQNDDLPQHSVRGQWDWCSASRWTLSSSLQASFWDDEYSLIARLLLQRSF